MISKMITHTLICLLAASLCHTHEEIDVPLTQTYGGFPQSGQTQGQPGPPSGSYTGPRPIGGCPYPGPINGAPSGVPGNGGLGPYGQPGGGFPNHPGEVIIPVNSQYPSPYYSQPGRPFPPQFIHGQTFVPYNNQYDTNSQHTNGPYHLPPCTKSLLEEGVGDKSHSATQDFTQPAYRIADGQDENLSGGFYLAPYRTNFDQSSGRNSESEDSIPLQTYDSRAADSAILTAVPVHPHFAHGINNYFHRFGFTRPLPRGGLIYSNTFSNHLHNNLY